MLRNRLYIHLDGISNSILSKGISHDDFHRYTRHRPSNLLLLNPNDREGEYETHTNFRVIRSEEAVERYFNLIKTREDKEVRWIDFADYDVLARLTANEIAELLYFGHMKMQLRSPFFYKLQNNYAFFNVNDSLSKMYFRNIEEFYIILSKKMTQVTTHKINLNNSFFRRRQTISEIPLDLIEQLKPLMQEGIVFDFEQMGLKSSTYQIPIYVVEDNLRKIDKDCFQSEEKIGRLIYDGKRQEWQIEKEEYQSLFMQQ
ncbi:hypothetical protein [Vagococcus sp.]|uniref:hypothetical protein n=1 Tax=Vagococcus sp. TaxID=1933889 RepID=UPI003F9503B6